MEFEMREWLTVIIVLLILGVLLDGWRRMRQSRQQSIKMSLSMHNGTEKEDLEGYGSELPNGGARVVGTRPDDDARALTRDLQASFEQNRTTSQFNRIPEQVALNLDEEVPMLMDPIDEAIHDTSGRVEPVIDSDLPLSEEVSESRQQEMAPQPEEQISAPQPPERQPAKAAEPVQEPAASAVEDEPAAEAEEVLVINVMAPKGTYFYGGDLLQVILECGMRYGDMQIFHRHQQTDGEGPHYFSMVNMVVPGTFDLNTMDQFETPGVSLFMTLPMKAKSLEAFNTMAYTAQTLAERLGGELKDENRSVMTSQTLEHCRQRIRDFERKQLSRA
ncbi:cell division protein ZipA [Pseudomaricurvus alkylphenolicus]|uniref:cell division protein ZipA n=1 Tax=Pseudomaricurvus alkylphenolicus TaxID=1306991 RepID=UPI001F0F519F|nr:cell division protein ZipA [Pseudomaricurvus alkylphenolicus]